MQTNINQRDSQGRKQGQWLMYRETTHTSPISDSFWYKDGLLHGECIIYDNDGEIRVKSNFEYGKKHGHWELYWWKDVIRSRGLFNKGNKYGLWQYYRTDGTHYLTELYAN